MTEDSFSTHNVETGNVTGWYIQRRKASTFTQRIGLSIIFKLLGKMSHARVYTN
ncbi:MAG: hypothetical protein ACXABY_36405 [Candidatus Thorarchaeota archaeon]